MSQERLRIFISSPGDVAEERVIANNLVRRLADEYAQRLWIEPVFWEHEPLLATETFQSQIPPPRDCDVAVCILWSRIGTRLPADITRQEDSRFGPAGSRYASGTEYEFEDAARGFERTGSPQLLVYRKTATPLVDISDENKLMRRLEQKKALDKFMEKWFFNEDATLKAAFHSFATTSEFEKVLEEHLRKLIRRRLESLPAASAEAAPVKLSWTSGSPFRGLEFFDFEHAPVFFGRTQAIGDVLSALRKNAADGRAFVLVLGVSGGGKSSLVRAGVLPVLTQPGVIEGVGLWRRAVLKPSDGGGNLLQALALALLAKEALPELGADGTTPNQLADLLSKNPTAAFLLIKGGLSQAAARLAPAENLPAQPEARLVLVVDQVEELFMLPNLTAQDRQAFVSALSSLARSGKVFVIATLRGDFYHRCLDLPDLVALKEGSGQYDLLLPAAAEIGQMIRQPARAAGLGFEEDPATRIPLDDVLREAASRSPESLPLLEFALEELYQRKTPQGMLTYEAYRELGGVEGALARRAEMVFAALTPEAQMILPRVMRGLVSVGEGEAVARRQARIDAVAPTADARMFVEAFVTARLFTADRAEGGDAVVRVTHEALLRNWPRIKQWLEQDKELLIVRGRVSAAAARWEKEQRAADLLLSEGKPLAEAENLAAKLGEELPLEERSFIALSQARRRRRKLVKRGAIAALLLLALASAITGVLTARARSLAARRLQSFSELTMLFDGVDASLNELPGTTPARSNLAEITLQCLNRFETDDNTDPVFLLALAKTNSKVATLLGNPYSANRGKVRQAMETYQKSRQILEKLRAADPGNDEAARTLAETYMGMGEVQEESGDEKGSLENCRRGLEAWTRLAAARPADRHCIHKKLRSWIGVGDAQWDLGHFAEGLEGYRKALEIGQQLTATGPAQVPADEERLSLLDLATAMQRIAVAQASLGLTAEALASNRQALNIRQKLLARFGGSPDLLDAVVVSYRKIADVCLAANDLPGALENYTQSMERGKPLFAADPTNSRWGRHLWANYQGLANTQLRLGKLPAALDHFHQALDLTQQMPATPEATFMQDQLSSSYQGIGETLVQLGRSDEALTGCQSGVDFAQKWAATDPDGVQSQMNLALARLRLAHAFAGLARKGESPANRIDAWKRAVAELEAAASIVNKAKTDHAFDAGCAVWFGTLEEELTAARKAARAQWSP
jgi:tetratricopeptide (TPR) repeat protein